jgi:quinol monooxygenase YgiN
MMISVLKLTPCSEKREAILRILQSIVPATLAKPGCVNCGVYEEYDSDHTILYSEQWYSEEDLYRHIQSNQFLRILSAMDFAKDPPQISFHEISNTRHLELVEDLRHQNDSSSPADKK